MVCGPGAAAGRGGARGRLWWPLAAVLGAPLAAALAALGVLAAAAAGEARDEPGGPRQADCAEALAFGGARLPAGAHDARCTVRTWLDTEYEAVFRMPRRDVRGRLRATYPDAPESGTASCVPDSAGPPGSADPAGLCLDLGLTEGDGNRAGRVPGSADPGFGAAAVQVAVVYEGPDQALVTFTAFTV
ncbi:hypothetical protein [Streptomyces sp. PsTaAH-124]|uniref:hypothetical protein n=1 Tax=Streptomyces sp. PsTaAH-124 TaxID=1157638 RepID=UPI000377C6DC|nr:hypothetical protein [Streptomyces sp. PsTaAH-124]